MSARPSRYTVAVDFDGVLHRYDTPWVSEHVIPDGPVEGAIEWLRSIEKDMDVVVFTTRGRTEEGAEAVRQWLVRHGWENGASASVTDRKPPALVYVDDRAWRFVGSFPTAADIRAARPWNKPVQTK